ncbi:hypothetical protein JG687_00017084 [Phytophthora cactorum]|uniref:Uncharacterized protein n=1 Tax=Phytophthora cactorum TaxID=29920 RepID=A0A8T1TP64_9STRA|nr:hypothetical protein JG687_00017084 [Phytophthora cactorum]
MYDGWSCFSEHYVPLNIVFWKDGQLIYILLTVAPLDEADLTAASHSTKSFLAEHEDLVGALSALMVALRTIKNCAELRRHTSLAPLCAKATRWSSTFMMLERSIVALVESLKMFNSVCKKLQEDSISMKAPTLRVFESAVVKVSSRGTEADLTPEELRVLHPFELEAAAAEPTLWSNGSGARTRARSDAEDFATALLQSRPISEQVTPRYNPIVAAIPPTSNHCERLLSQCRLVMTPQHASLLPMNFEMIVFLRANRMFWDANMLMSLDVDDTDEN